MNFYKTLPAALGSLSLERIVLLVGLFAMSCLGSDAAFSETSLPSGLDAGAEQSFLAPQSWAKELTAEQGWGSNHVRLLADVNGDKRQDIVGFGTDGVWLATSTGTSFSPAFVLADFGYQSAWRVQKHVRVTGDINGDEMEDIVGFGDAGVYRALSNGSGFTSAARVVEEFGYDQGWRIDQHVRLLADVNGDGRKDIVGFGDDGVWLSLATSSGNFSAAMFVLEEFGSHQGWTPAKHIRTTADVNGDGRQDIVGFGDDWVWTALSTGNGFAPARNVLADFGYQAGGWKVDRHLRLMADMNKDGKQDIVAIGNDGVYLARSTGDGFEAPQFVIANFGYNSGWRVALHPRFVADLNGDGYQDIVGYGQDSIYRALGGPDGFGGVRGVLRDLVADLYPFNSNNSAQFAPRFVGDVNADSMQDLVAFDQVEIKVAPSSNLPPPAPPAAPSNPRITAKTTTSLTVAWNDNSSNERKFFVYFGKSDNGTQTYTVGANATSRVFNSLAADTQYCFSVQAESLFGISAETARACGSTSPEPVNNGPFTTSISMARQPIVQGFVPYLGTFGPINTGANISKINFPTQFPAVLLVKPGHSTNECGNPAAVVLVHGDMTADQKKAIWGSATPSISGLQTLYFVGCTTSGQLPDLLPVNITWSHPPQPPSPSPSPGPSDPGPDPEPDPGPYPCVDLSATPSDDANPRLRRRPDCEG
ncbi:MAG: FG-GAP-like repeat-containing protein [Methylococcales bacterium]|nr:FG-GAP-like repeat-containing protein [Methylococcales bacterium]